MSPDYDTGMGTTPGMWQMLSDVIEGEKLPEALNEAIYALRDEKAKIVPDPVDLGAPYIPRKFMDGNELHEAIMVDADLYDLAVRLGVTPRDFIADLDANTRDEGNHPFYEDIVILQVWGRDAATISADGLYPPMMYVSLKGLLTELTRRALVTEAANAASPSA